MLFIGSYIYEKPKNYIVYSTKLGTQIFQLPKLSPKTHINAYGLHQLKLFYSSSILNSKQTPPQQHVLLQPVLLLMQHLVK